MTVGVGSTKRAAVSAAERKAASPRAVVPQKPVVSWVKVDSAAKQGARVAVPVSATGKPVPQPRQPAVDLGAIKVGVTLRHKAFGLGVVKKFQGSYIIVDFGGNEKKFLFPAAVLEGYLN